MRAVWLDCLDRHSPADPQGLCSRAREPAEVCLGYFPAQPRMRSSVLPSFRLAPVSTANMRCVSRRVTTKGAPLRTRSVIYCLPRAAILQGESCARVGTQRAPAGADGETAFRVPTGEAHSGGGAKTNEPTNGNSQRAAPSNVDPRGELIPQSD